MALPLWVKVQIPVLIFKWNQYRSTTVKLGKGGAETFMQSRLSPLGVGSLHTPNSPLFGVFPCHDTVRVHRWGKNKPQVLPYFILHLMAQSLYEKPFFFFCAASGEMKMKKPAWLAAQQ